MSDSKEPLQEAGGSRSGEDVSDGSSPVDLKSKSLSADLGRKAPSKSLSIGEKAPSKSVSKGSMDLGGEAPAEDARASGNVGGEAPESFARSLSKSLSLVMGGSLEQASPQEGLEPKPSIEQPEADIPAGEFPDGGAPLRRGVTGEPEGGPERRKSVQFSNDSKTSDYVRRESGKELIDESHYSFAESKKRSESVDALLRRSSSLREKNKRDSDARPPKLKPMTAAAPIQLNEMTVVINENPKDLSERSVEEIEANLHARLKAVEKTMGEFAAAPPSIESTLTEAQDPYSHKIHRAECKLLEPLGILELDKLQEVRENKAKPVFSTAVLRLRQMYQEAANPNAANPPSVSELLLQIENCHDKLVQKHPIIPAYTENVRSLMPIIENAHRVGQYLDGIGLKARQVAMLKDDITRLIDHQEELVDLYPLLEIDDIQHTYELEETVATLQGEADDMLQKIDKIKRRIEIDLTRFSVAEKAVASAKLMDQISK